MVEQKIEDIYKAQDKTWQKLTRIVEYSRVGSSYLFTGPQGSGKEALAIKFAQLLNCENKLNYPCNRCFSCKRFLQLQHEHLTIIFPLPSPKNKIKDSSNFIDSKVVELINNQIKIKSKDLFHKITIPKSNRILFQSIKILRKSLYLKSENQGTKIVVIFDAHLLSMGQGESANALLKLLEEPPNQTTLILVTHKSNLLFPTIISRCQKISVPKLNERFIINWLREQEVKESNISLIAGLSDGNIYHAKYLISESLDELLLQLSENIKKISNNQSHEWKDFIQFYSKMATHNQQLFSFHLCLLKIWFQSVNRLEKNLNHLLHKTRLKLGMDRLIKKFPRADYTSIAFEIDQTNFAVYQHLYMPLVMTNFLIKVKKCLNK